MPYNETPTEGTALLNKLTFKKSEPSDLEVEIARVLKVMKDMDPSDKVYAEVADQLVKLQKLQTEIDSKKRLSPDTLLNAATSFLSVLAILNYEHAHVFTSKATSFVKSIR
jgi:hypothetical protein